MDGRRGYRLLAWVVLVGAVPSCSRREPVEALPTPRETLAAAGQRLSRSLSPGDLSALSARGDRLLAALSPAERDALGRGYLRFRVDRPAVVDVAADARAVPFWLADQGFAPTGGRLRRRRRGLAPLPQGVRRRLGGPGGERPRPDARRRITRSSSATPTAARSSPRGSSATAGGSRRPARASARPSTPIRRSDACPTNCGARRSCKRRATGGTRPCWHGAGSGRRTSSRAAHPTRWRSPSAPTRRGASSGPGGPPPTSPRPPSGSPRPLPRATDRPTGRGSGSSAASLASSRPPTCSTTRRSAATAPPRPAWSPGPSTPTRSATARPRAGRRGGPSGRRPSGPHGSASSISATRSAASKPGASGSMPPSAAGPTSASS